MFLRLRLVKIGNSFVVISRGDKIILEEVFGSFGVHLREFKARFRVSEIALSQMHAGLKRRRV